MNKATVDIRIFVPWKTGAVCEKKKKKFLAFPCRIVPKAYITPGVASTSWSDYCGSVVPHGLTSKSEERERRVYPLYVWYTRHISGINIHQCECYSFPLSLPNSFSFQVPFLSSVNESVEIFRIKLYLQLCILSNEGSIDSIYTSRIWRWDLLQRVLPEHLCRR